MLKIFKDTKIFVLCPAGVVTGGPESLHALVWKLRYYGHDAKMVFYPEMKDPSPKQFSHYRVRWTGEIRDEKENILIVPEIKTKELDKYFSIQKVVWWLSVDYHYTQNVTFTFDELRNRGVVHLAQSKYAEAFLKNHGAEYINSLTAPINKEFFKKGKEYKREDIVLYSPVKGFEYIQRLMKASPSLFWVPIENMERREIIGLMRRSKVYVDFGHFPGRDRIPREAVLNGLCIIVGDSGAGAFHQDVPVPDGYRFPTADFQPKQIVMRIRDCLKNYDTRVADFEQYRRIVLTEQDVFTVQCKRIFGGKVNRIKNFIGLLSGAFPMKYRIKETFKQLKQRILSLLPDMAVAFLVKLKKHCLFSR